MAKEMTDKSRYESSYGGGFINKNQYLAEFICQRLAEHKKTTLVYRFWENPEWSKVFITQCVMAGRLLKKYDIKLILYVLKLPYMSWCYSLGNPSLKKQLENNKNLFLKDKPTSESITIQVNEDNVNIRPTVMKKQEKTLRGKL